MITDDRCAVLDNSTALSFKLLCRRKDVMRIGDGSLFETDCRERLSPRCYTPILTTPGVECPSIGASYAISTKARVQCAVRLGSFCVVGARVLLVSTDEEALDDDTVVFRSDAETRVERARVCAGGGSAAQAC